MQYLPTTRSLLLLRLVLPLLLCGNGLSALADSPPTIPATHVIWSRNHRYYAISDVKSGLTTAYRGAVEGRGKKLWTQKGWVRSAFLANDGQHFIVGYPGQNLLSLQHARNETMLWFYKEGKLRRRVTLDQLIRDRSHLRRTVSHYDWGNVQGLNKNEELVVQTVEDKTLYYNLDGYLKRFSQGQ